MYVTYTHLFFLGLPRLVVIVVVGVVAVVAVVVVLVVVVVTVAAETSCSFRCFCLFLA